MRRLWLAAAALGGIASSCGRPDRPVASARPVWVVDPKESEPLLPRVGRSLFDFLVTRDVGGRRVYDVPYPFAALVRRLGAEVERAEMGSPLKMVLVPRGRSLQRDAARPEFFRFPRAVVATDAEPRVAPGHSGVLLKDRLYLGYQEKADILEVISYNEAGGRFEFQVVRDYREGSTPRVVYANRALCMACHQNGAAIFARPLWDETNANLEIAGRLASEHRDFYGLPLEPGVDVPYFIDNATDRANLLSAWQLLWQDGCGGSEAEAIRCRADLLTFLLQYRLSGSRRFDTRSPAFRERLLPALARRAAARWPAGWRVPNADLPNRNPLRAPARAENADGRSATAALGPGAASIAEVVRRSDVPSELEPLLSRAPLAVWPPPGTDVAGIERTVAGLAGFLAEADVRRLDARLAALGIEQGGASKTYASACAFDEGRSDGTRRVSFVCRAPAESPKEADGVFALEGRIFLDATAVRRGSIDAVSVDGLDEMPEAEVTGGTVRTVGKGVEAEIKLVQSASRLQARRANGEAVQVLVLQWPQGGVSSDPAGRAGRGLLRTRDDFGPARAAIDALAARTASGASDVLGPRPFRRASVMSAVEAELGSPVLAWCCEDTTGMPPADPDAHARDAAGPSPAGHPAARHQVFLRYCGRCHESADRFPPNFLHGTPVDVDAKLARCAERIYFRLEMWRLDAARRPKTPMPPENALERLAVSRDEWPAHADLRALHDYVGDILKSESGTAPRIETLEARGYEDLRSCLPEPVRSTAGAPSPVARP